MLNDTLGEWCHTNNDRFSFVASVPLVDAVDAAAELDRAVDLGAVAVMVPANVEGVNIGEKPLDPFWARRKHWDCRSSFIPCWWMLRRAPRSSR
jgi:aminocarboxymuconate-semialdehyde decarboxylase